MAAFGKLVVLFFIKYLMKERSSKLLDSIETVRMTDWGSASNTTSLALATPSIAAGSTIIPSVYDRRAKRRGEGFALWVGLTVATITNMPLRLFEPPHLHSTPKHRPCFNDRQETTRRSQDHLSTLPKPHSPVLK